MTYQSELQRLVEAKASMRQSIIDKGVEVPESAKIEDYPGYIEQISTAPPSALAKFKAALDAGTAETDYPVGTEIPDTYDGNPNPLIVAQYLNSTNNSAYGDADGAILIRKYVEPTSQIFGNKADYATSTIKNFLDTTYLNNCSEALKSVIAEVNIPYNNTTLKSKMFLMSAMEVCSDYSSTVEGEMWDLWKQRTGLTSPNSGNNNGRIVKDRNGTAQNVWLRSLREGTRICNIYASGGYVSSVIPSLTRGVLPACFIAKS